MLTALCCKEPFGSILTIGPMRHAFACILAIAGWYLVYPPATHNGNPESYTALSGWNIDGSYSTAADCHEGHHDDLIALQGLEQTSRDYLQTQIGRCVASDDPRLAK
jgi:hypothetical protein